MPNWTEAISAADTGTDGTLDPSVLNGIATAANSTGDAVTNAKAVAAFTNANSTIANLRGLTKTDQRSAWKTYTSQQQDALKAAGYQLPAGGGGIFGLISKDVVAPFKRDVLGDVVSPFLRDVYSPIMNVNIAGTHPIASPLNVLGSGSRAVQHLARAVAYGGDIDQSEGKGLYSILWSPDQWAASWDATEHGEQVYLPSQVRKIQADFAPDVVALAKQVASGQTQALLNATPNDPNATDADGLTAQQALAKRIDTDPDVAAAVQRFINAKMSVGRTAVGPDMLNNHPALGHFLAGILDATADFSADPVNLATSGAGEAANARYFVDSPAALDALRNSTSLIGGGPGYRALLDSVAGNVAKGDASAIARETPNIKSPIIRDLIQTHADTPDAVHSYLTGDVGFQNLLQGKAIRNSDNAGMMIAPHIGVTRQAVNLTRGGLGTAATTFGEVPVVGKTLAIFDHPIDFLAEARARDVTGALTPRASQRVLSPLSTLDAHPYINAAFHPIATGESAVGRTLKKLLTPDETMRAAYHGGGFNVDDPNALDIIHNYASAFLPRLQTDRAVNAFAAAEGTNTQMDIWNGIVDSVLQAGGTDLTENGAKWRAQTMNSAKGGINRNIYSAAPNPTGLGRNDLMMDGEIEGTAGLLENQQAHTFAMPSTAEIFANSRKASITRSVMGSVPMQLVDHLMPSWRVLTLLPSLGFGQRMIINEGLTEVLRDGLRNVVNARLAASTMPDSAGRISDLLNTITAHLPGETLQRIKTPEELTAELLADNVSRAYANVVGRPSRAEIRDAMMEASAFGKTDGVLPDLLSATHGNSPLLDDGSTNIQKVAASGRVTRRRMAPTGAHVESKTGDELQHYNLAQNYNEIARSRWARVALGNINAPEDQRVGEVADALQADPYWHTHSKRSIKMSSGEYVGVPGGALGPDGLPTAGGEVTERQAAIDHAQRIVNHVNAYVHTPDGMPIPVDNGTMADFLLKNRKGPTVAALSQMPPEMLPVTAYGPEMQSVSSNWFQEMAEKGFTTLVGRPLNAIVREPAWGYNYTMARREVRQGGLAAQLIKSAEAKATAEHAAAVEAATAAGTAIPTDVDLAARLAKSHQGLGQVMADVAHQRALERTQPMIHDPGARSQFSVITRNIAPFWYAQEQSYKRWARAFVANPRSIREAMLLNQGVMHSGFVHTDPQNGNKYFVYPGSAFADKALNALASKVSGTEIKLPVSVNAGLVGDPNLFSPLRSQPLPNPAPLASMPLTALTNRFPELQPIKQALMPGQGGAQYLKEIMPSNVMKVLEAGAPDMFNHVSYNSAFMHTIAAEAAGGGFRTDANGNIEATPEEEQAMMDKIRNFTRIRVIQRALFSTIGPSAAQYDTNDMDARLQTLTNELGPEGALAVFQKEYPNATPHTVYQSRSVSGGSLPATAASLDWMTSHGGDIKQYPYGAAFLLPTPAKGTPYDPTAYQEQLATGLRIRKTPQQFMDDVLYSSAADTYFKTDQQKNNLLAHTASAAAKTNINAQWKAWSDQYFKDHPVFDKVLNGGADGLPPASWTRVQVQSDLSQALNKDPRFATDPTYDTLRTLVNAYDDYTAKVKGIPANAYRVAAIKKQMGEGFAQMVFNYVQAHPETQNYFNRVIRPGMTPAINALGLVA